MIHTLIIRPSRVELVLKTFSVDYNKLSEKKLLSKEFSFRFNREIIDTGAYYKSFYRILAFILQPYKKDIKQLQVSLRSSFFQVRSIHCEEDMSSDSNYINWEVEKTINDVSEHFKYGYFYEKTIKKLHLFVIRKSVESYFDDILKKIISSDVNFNVGYDFITESKENVFVNTNKLVNKPFGSNQSSIRMWNIPTEKIRSEVRFKRTLISTIILFLLLSSFYLTYFQSENLYNLYTNIFHKADSITNNNDIPNLKNNTNTEVQKHPVVKKTSSEEKFLAKLFDEENNTNGISENLKSEIKLLNTHDILDSLISYNPTSLIFENNESLIQFDNKNSLNKFLLLANKYNIDIISKDNYFLDIRIGGKTDKYLPVMNSNHKRICKELKLDTEKEYLVLKTKNIFYKLTDILHGKDLIYDKFVISNRGNKLFLAVYFD